MEKKGIKLLTQFSILVFFIFFLVVVTGANISHPRQIRTTNRLGIYQNDLAASNSASSTDAVLPLASNSPSPTSGSGNSVSGGGSPPSTSNQLTGSPSQTTASQPTATPIPKLIDQLAQHNSPSDCWVSYQGHVYDLTTYFGSHPGGDATLAKYCGKDMAVGFNTKDRSPAQAHSATAMSLLANYQIE